MRIESCVFEKCRHSSRESESAAVLLIYDNPFDSAIANSAFIDNDPHESTTVTVAFGHALVLSRCCFTGPRAKELRDPNAGPGAEFDAGSCATGTLFRDGGVGFAPDRTAVPVKSRRTRRRPSPRTPGGAPGDVAFAPTAIACVAIAAILTALQTLLRKACRNRIKVPAALL
jgi:hypothetical protein